MPFGNLGGSGPFRLAHMNGFRLIQILLLRMMPCLAHLLLFSVFHVLNLYLESFSILYNALYPQELNTH